MVAKLITVDGPSGVGKGTLSRLLAAKLGWKWLDSGVLYRLLAYLAVQDGVEADDIDRLVNLVAQLRVEFSVDPNEPIKISLNGEDVTHKIRTEIISQMASKVSSHGPVRAALLQRQRDFFTNEGLVTDGRDMGTVVFPDAPLKFYLTASPEVRAERRRKQLILQGVDVNMHDLLAEIRARDERDRNRAVAPLKPAKDAITIDTSDLSIDQVESIMMDKVKTAGL